MTRSLRRRLGRRALAWALWGWVACAGFSILAQAASLEPESPGLGEEARLRLDTAPADSTEFPVGIGVALWPTEDASVFRARPLRVGRVGIVFSTSPDTLWWEIARNIEQADPSLLRPLRHTGGLTPSWWRQIAVGLLLLAVMFWVLRRFVRRTRPVALSELEIREPPHLVALRRLDAVSRSGWLEAGRFDDWYVEGSHALREYLGGRYRVAALDWTSGELVARLVESGYPQEDLAPVEPLLLQADTVKFARSRPSEHEAQDWLARCSDFVRRTAVEVVYSTPEALGASQRLNQGALR